VILSAQSIRKRAGMIVPFNERTVHLGMTYGLDCAGYDVRIDRTMIMWPQRFAMADTVERFSVPPDLKMRILDKSSWARRGVTVQNTTAEPGWRGFLRLELTNHSWRFRIIRQGSPIAQVEFHQLDHATEQPYSGKYQDQGHDQNAVYEVA
jgi:dCTP deaminase